MKLNKLAGATSEIWQVFIQDSSSTTGAGLTGLAFNTGSLTAYYHRDTDTTATAISLVTMTVGTFTSSGFKEIDATNMPGWYQFCPPNAALASGAKSCGFHLKGASNMAPLPIEVQLVAVNPDDSVRFGLTALPNAAAEASGGLYTRGTGAGQIAQDANGNVRVNLDTIKTNPVVNAGTVTFPTGATLASTTNITAGTIATVTTVTNQLTAAAIAAAVWRDAVAADFTQSASIGLSIMNGVALGTGLTINGYTGNTPQTGDAYARIGANGISLSAIPDLTGVTTLLSRLSSARAGYLDNINNAALSTTAAQTGDGYARLGAPAGASVSADIAAAKVDTAAIKLVTIKLDSMITFGVGSPSDYAFNITAMENAPTGSGASAATIAAAVWDEARSGHVSAGTFGHGVIVDVIATDAVDANALKADAVTEIQSGLSTLTAAGVRTAVGLGSANLDTQLAALPTAIQNADALLNRDMSVGTDSGSPTVRTPRQAFRFLRNKWSIAAGTLTVTKEDDTTASWTGAVAGTAGADPVTSVDPA